MKFFLKNWKQKLAIFLIVFIVYYIVVGIFFWYTRCTPDDLGGSTALSDHISCAIEDPALLLIVFPTVTLLGFILLPLIFITHLIMPNFTYPFGWIGFSFATFLIGDGLRLFLGLVVTLFIAYSLYFLLTLLKKPKK